MGSRSNDARRDPRLPPRGAAETGEALIPTGEQACVWMQAGLLAWRLCDLDYHCERCPLDAAMRHHGDAAVQAIRAEPPAEDLPVAVPPAPPAHPAYPGTPAGMESLLRLRLPSLDPAGLYHPAHTWVRRDSPGRARIGLDAFAVRIAGHPRGVVLPPPGTHLRQGHPCAWLDTPGGTLTVLAPISGLVVEGNGEVVASPERIGAEPFAAGWLLVLLPSNWEREESRLTPAADFHRTLARDLVTWRSSVLQAMRSRSPAIGPTLADGGARVTDLDELLGARRRCELALPFFTGHPRQPPRCSQGTS